ncbi:SufD family Fe-S cluster assembly protein [Marispirochaeta aestuarii]|uniref:SufB/SufD family protein n=1 Tax=Marispirochaeta aestuarii TaxID=1963862 RepID=UPI0029C7C741|nr:SufD family Fe-S cluster assembly protein [Marispirochaeta aestuarii]
MSADPALEKLLSSINMHKHNLDGTAHLEIDGNRILGSGSVPGFHLETDTSGDGIIVRVRVEAGYRFEKPVHLCFGMLPEEGIQKIDMAVDVEEGAAVSFLAHCSFPNAVDVQHLMDARLNVGPNARYSYFERHVHAENGGINVVPKSVIRLAEGARFKTEFELLKGRVGILDMDYSATAEARSQLDMLARIYAREDDRVKIREAAELNGEGATGVLVSHLAVRGDASAEIYSDLSANAPGCRGHVDCKEIVQDRGKARAIPIVSVNHPLAHVTHEAAIGSVDSKQLQTLMARGLDEEDATDLIIQGLLS